MDGWALEAMRLAGHIPTMMRFFKPRAAAVLLCCVALPAFAADKIVHDAEHYILEAQHGERWAAEDEELDAKLAALREKNAGKPPNILYILIDDVGFGELGSVELNQVRG